MGFLSTPEFWVAVSFFIFLVTFSVGKFDFFFLVVVVVRIGIVCVRILLLFFVYFVCVLFCLAFLIQLGLHVIPRHHAHHDPLPLTRARLVRLRAVRRFPRHGCDRRQKRRRRQ